MPAMVRATLLLALGVGLAAGRALRTTPAANVTIKAHEAVAEAPESSQKEITALRAKLQTVSAGLATLLNGALKNSKLAPEFETFLSELKVTLNETATEKDSAKALKRLKDAQAGVKALTEDMTHQQERLMKETEDQTLSLLLGVLTTRAKEPMEKQLEVIKSEDFAKLAVVKAVLAANDTKTPLIQQVGAWLDKHSPAPTAGSPSWSPAAEKAAPEIPDKLKAGKDGKPDVTPIVQALEVRLDSLKDHEKREAELHSKVMKELDAAEEKEKEKSPKRAHRIELMKKKETRKYAKQDAMNKHDVKSMNDAIDAIKKGDMKALMKAQSALMDSMKAMQAQSGGFLYLIQLGHRSQSLDCPYCAAQCFDKCHASGKSYTTCLTDCADAGK